MHGTVLYDCLNRWGVARLSVCSQDVAHGVGLQGPVRAPNAQCGVGVRGNILVTNVHICTWSMLDGTHDDSRRERRHSLDQQNIYPYNLKYLKFKEAL